MSSRSKSSRAKPRTPGRIFADPLTTALVVFGGMLLFLSLWSVFVAFLADHFPAGQGLRIGQPLALSLACGGLAALRVVYRRIALRFPGRTRGTLAPSGWLRWGQWVTVTYQVGGRRYSKCFVVGREVHRTQPCEVRHSERWPRLAIVPALYE
jgi:hypothetical protein